MRLFLLQNRSKKKLENRGRPYAITLSLAYLFYENFVYCVT